MYDYDAPLRVAVQVSLEEACQRFKVSLADVTHVNHPWGHCSIEEFLESVQGLTLKDMDGQTASLVAADWTMALFQADFDSSPGWWFRRLSAEGRPIRPFFREEAEEAKRCLAFYEQRFQNRRNPRGPRIVEPEEEVDETTPLLSGPQRLKSSPYGAFLHTKEIRKEWKSNSCKNLRVRCTADHRNGFHRKNDFRRAA